MIRALFLVVDENRGLYAGQRTYKLRAVSPQDELKNDPEVETFWEATPSGEFSIVITNPGAYLTLGKKYYIDFTPHADDPLV